MTLVNLCPNGSFEHDTTGGNPAGWTVGHLFQVQAVTFTGSVGSHSCIFASGLTQTDQAVQVTASAVAASTSYEVSLAFQQATSSGGSLQVGIQWYDSGNTLISTSTGSAGANVGLNGTGTVSVTASSPSNAASAKVILTKGFDTSQYSVDAINFAPASQGTAYHDGDSGGGWAWTGTTGNSISQNATVAGTGTGSFTFAGSATGSAHLPGTAGGAFSFTGAATGTAFLPATGTGTFAFAGASTGTVVYHATGTATFGFTGTAAATSPGPTVITGLAEALPGLQETLNGTVNPEGAATTYSFQWGTSPSYGNTTTAVSAGSGSSPVAASATISGLTAGTLYHYRLSATNSSGTSYGADQTFYPFAPPAPQTNAVRVWTDQNPFTYCFYDLLSGQFKGSLPLTQVSFNSQLLQPGSFNGVIDVASQAVQNLGPFDLIEDGRTALLVDYLGSFIWGGICWTSPYEQDDTKRQVTVNATELWSWIQNSRVQATDYSAPPYSGITGNSSVMPIWDATLTDVGNGGPGVYDPVLIAWQMLSDALYYVPNANLFGGTGIAANGYTSAANYLASGTATPQLDYISVNYPYSSMQQLGSAINQNATLGLGIGFDYMMDVSGSARGPVTCTVNLSYPRRGRLFSQNNLVLDTQRALSFTIPPDATQTANTVYEQGANGALSVSQNAQPLNGGYPILERIMSRSNIQSANVMAVLQQTGAADLAIYSYPLYTPTVTTDLFTGPLQLGQFILGDDVYWRIPKTNGVGGTFCPRYPQGLAVEGRIIAWSATVADAGTSTLQVSLAEPPSYSVQGSWLP